MYFTEGEHDQGEQPRQKPILINRDPNAGLDPKAPGPQPEPNPPHPEPPRRPGGLLSILRHFERVAELELRVFRCPHPFSPQASVLEAREQDHRRTV